MNNILDEIAKDTKIAEATNPWDTISIVDLKDYPAKMQVALVALQLEKLGFSGIRVDVHGYKDLSEYPTSAILYNRDTPEGRQIEWLWSLAEWDADPIFWVNICGSVEALKNSYREENIPLPDKVD